MPFILTYPQCIQITYQGGSIIDSNTKTKTNIAFPPFLLIQIYLTLKLILKKLLFCDLSFDLEIFLNTCYLQNI